MPGMPVFQDIASQLKSQVYVFNTDTNEIVPLQVDNTGLPVSGTVELAAGTTVELAPGAEVSLTAGTTVGLTAGTQVDLAPGAEVSLAAGTTVGLTAGTQVDLAPGATVDLAAGAIVGLAAGTNNIGTVELAAGTEVDLAPGAEVGLTAGTTVGLDAGTNVIGKVQNDLVFTSHNAFNLANPILAGETITANTPTDSLVVDISKESSYNWFFKNGGNLSSQDVVVRVQLSPDGINWVDDTGVDIPIANGETKMITVNNFLQYAKFTVSGNSVDVTVYSCFQAQH